MHSRYDTQDGSTVLIAIIILFIIIGLGSWIVFLRQDAAPTSDTRQQESGQQPDSTLKEPGKSLLERADYIYNQFPEITENRYSKLEAKGFINSSLAEEGRKKSSSFDLITCSQDAAEKYTFSEPQSDDGPLTFLDVTGTYEASGALKIRTGWLSTNTGYQLATVECPPKQ